MKKLILLICSIFLIGCGKADEGYEYVQVYTPKEPYVVKASEQEIVKEQEEIKAETQEVTVPNEGVTIRVGYMPNYGSLWAIESAIANDMFAEGVSIEMTEFPDGPSIIAELEAGNLDVGYIGQGAHKHVINKGLKIFALSHIANADMIIGNSNIHGILDVQGKNVGYTPDTSSQVILEAALSAEGLSAEDVNLMTLEDCGTDSFLTAMNNGVIDAVATWSPESLDILEGVEGATELADNMSVEGMSISLSSWICTADFASKELDKLKLFADGLFKGMEYGADSNHESIAELVATRTGVDKSVAYAQRGDADWYTANDIVQSVTDGSIEMYYTMQQDSFIVSGDVRQTPVSNYVMLDFMRELAK